MSATSNVVLCRRFIHPSHGWITVRWMKSGIKTVEMDIKALGKLGVNAECRYQKNGYRLELNGEPMKNNPAYGRALL